MKRTPAFLVLLLPACLTLRAGRQDPATAEGAAARIEQRLSSLRSLRADFEQTFRPASKAPPLVEKGRLYFQRPDRMRWEYTEPEAKVFLFKDGIFEQFYPGDNQLIRSRISEQDSGAEILSLLTGARKLSDSYEVELEPPAAGKLASTRLKLTPRREGEFSHVLLEASNATSLLLRAEFVDFSGNSTEFVFQRAKADARLPPGIFVIKAPEGCEVIDDLGPGRS